jgi:hypothetical protein
MTLNTDARSDAGVALDVDKKDGIAGGLIDPNQPSSVVAWPNEPRCLHSSRK